MNSNKSQQQKTLEQYTKSCIKNNPYSLSMLKSPLEVVNKVYSLYNCVCLIYWPLCERQIFCDYFIIKDWIETDLNMKVISFQTREQIVLYLNQIQPSISVFIIYHSKEQYGLYSLLTEVMGRKQVKLTIVYCLDSYKDIIKYHPSKKKEIADNITQVMTLLEEEKKKCFDRRQAPNSLFSLKNKTEEQKIYVEVIFAMLNQQIDRVHAAKSFQLLFKEMLFDEREGLQEISEFVKLVQRKLPLQDVFTWYTKQTFVFSLLGKVMRYCHDPRQVYYIQPFFQDLYKSIQTLYQFQVQNKEQKILQCFRGGKIEQKQLKYLKQNVGHIIQNRLFLSTTTQQSITLHYIQNIKYKITISHDSVVSHEQRNKGYINPGYAQIKQYSFYSSEQEVLFNPLNYFLIKSLNQEMINDIQYYELCMEFIDMARILSMQDNIMSEQQKQIKDEGLKQLQLRKKIKCQGDVLSNNTNVYPQGNYQYWKQFLANSNNQEQICIGLDHLCRYHKKIQNLQEEKDQFSAYF